MLLNLAELIRSVGVLGSQTFKLLFCIYNKLFFRYKNRGLFVFPVFIVATNCKFSDDWVASVNSEKCKFVENKLKLHILMGTVVYFDQ